MQNCEHIARIQYGLTAQFLSPYTTKTIWTCLYDGCSKIKKDLDHAELQSYTAKLSNLHKVMINCQTLQIYCTACQIEIFDQEKEGEQKQKVTKQTGVNPFHFRQLLMEKRQQPDNVFGGSVEYPPSFQKEKRGVCGLKMHSLTSYINSVIQLLAYTPSMKAIASEINPTAIQLTPLRILFTLLKIIWEGKYRIYDAGKLQLSVMKHSPKMKEYANRTAQSFLYQILRYLAEELSYTQLKCSQPQIVSQGYCPWRPSISNSMNTSTPTHTHTHTHTRSYSPMKEMFAGECILEIKCSSCGHSRVVGNKFECLKLTFQSGYYQHNQMDLDLLKLISEALKYGNTSSNRHNTNHNPTTKQQKNKKDLCAKCKQSTIHLQYSYVHLPNNLILQFGDSFNGLNVNLPNLIDLTEYSEEYVKGSNSTNNGGSTNGGSINNKEIAVYELVGYIYRSRKWYITQVRNLHTKREYNIHDQTICEGEKRQKNIKIAIYKRKPNEKNQSLARNVLSSIELSVNPIVPLPDFWEIYLTLHHSIQPLMNPYICQHGRIQSQSYTLCKTTAIKRIPVQIYEYLLQTFGGRKIMSSSTQFKFDCQQCKHIKEILAEIRESEKEMASFADKLSNKKHKLIISIDWLQKWRQFVYQNEVGKNYNLYGHPRPGPLSHKDGLLVGQSNNYDPKTYKKVSQEVYYFLRKFYSGGSLLIPAQYKPNTVIVTAVDLRFQAIKHLLKQITGQAQGYGYGQGQKEGKISGEVLKQIEEVEQECDKDKGQKQEYKEEQQMQQYELNEDQRDA